MKNRPIEVGVEKFADLLQSKLQVHTLINAEVCGASTAAVVNFTQPSNTKAAAV